MKYPKDAKACKRRPAPTIDEGTQTLCSHIPTAIQRDSVPIIVFDALEAKEWNCKKKKAAPKEALSAS
jgi:hypothetical protein